MPAGVLKNLKLRFSLQRLATVAGAEGGNEEAEVRENR